MESRGGCNRELVLCVQVNAHGKAHRMKLLAFLLILMAIPVFFVMIRSERGYALGCFLLGFFPFCLNALNLDFAIINWVQWPGYAKGMVVTILDSLSLAFLLHHRNTLTRLPFLALFIAYVLAIAISAFSSSIFTAAGFYVFQLLRVFALFVAVAAAVERPSGFKWLTYGLAWAAVLQGIVTISERAAGTFQADGTMAHQNMLGFMLHFVILPLGALALAGDRRKVLLLAIVCALIAVALGASRASIGFLVVGLSCLVALSLWRASSPRKWKIAAFGAIIAVLISPVAISGLEQRLTSTNLEGSSNERHAFEQAARLMIADNPMGVGANHYVLAANVQGYSDRAGVIWNSSSRAAHVHQLYLLTAAEGGFLALGALIALFVWPIVRGVRFAFERRRDMRGDVVLGSTIALAAAALHSFYEWIFVSYQAQYVFAITLGLMAGLIRQRANEVHRVDRRHGESWHLGAATPKRSACEADQATQPRTPSR